MLVVWNALDPRRSDEFDRKKHLHEWKAGFTSFALVSRSWAKDPDVEAWRQADVPDGVTRFQ